MYIQNLWPIHFRKISSRMFELRNEGVFDRKWFRDEYSDSIVCLQLQKSLRCPTLEWVIHLWTNIGIKQESADAPISYHKSNTYGSKFQDHVMHNYALLQPCWAQVRWHFAIGCLSFDLFISSVLSFGSRIPLPKVISDYTIQPSG